MTESPDTSSTLTRIETLFEAAVQLQGGERAAYLDAQCADDAGLRAEVEALLAADGRSGGVLDAPLEAAAPGLLATASPSTPAPPGLDAGTRVGPYRVVREIGRGGMGVVYLAERADGAYQRQVALKVVRASPVGETLERRFLDERRILARLQHPGIARLLDAGVTESGASWLAMELVSGDAITAWAAARSLSVEARLHLFLEVCAAVQAAHRNLVVHRDLKPANILVTDEGQVRLLDFGIARLLDDETQVASRTRTGLMLLTPEYAAPEQIRGEPASTATDVYSLGAVLYELLSGRRPFELATHHIEEILRVRSEAPPRLSRRADIAPALRRRLRGDVECIVGMALSMDPDRRYGSVESLAADVRRHLEHEPVEAQRESVWYLAAKFVRRHRAGVAASAAIAAAVIAGFIGTLWQSHERELQARKAEEVKTFVLGLFSGADPARARGAELTARELVAEGSARIQREFSDQPAVKAEVLTLLGDIHEKLGDPDRALAAAEQALQVLGGAGAGAVRRANAVPRANAQVVKGRALLAKGQLPQAEELLREALATHRAERASLATAEDLDQLAIVARQQGKLADSRRMTQEALQIRERELGPRHPEVATSLNNMGVVEREAGDYAAALSFHQRALAIRRQALPSDHPETGFSLNNLGALLFAQGRYAEAERYFREVQALDARVYGVEHPATIGATNNLGSALLLQAKYGEAEPLLKSVLAYWQKTAGEMHPNALVTLSNLATVYRGQARYDEAIPLYLRLIGTWRKVAGAQHPNVAVAHYHLGTMLGERGELGPAESHLRTSLEIRRAARGDEHPEVADSERELGSIALRRGRVDEADKLVSGALSVQRKMLEAGHPSLAATLLAHGAILRARSELQAAREEESEALRMLRARFPADHPDIARALLELGRTEVAAREFAAAETSLRDARGILAPRYGAASQRVAEVDSLLAVAARQGSPVRPAVRQ